ncbi:hypothetical protein PISMIDRAFT_671911 [Pisolithus microcarpus 441]|uniref:Uncharacterized protein n=1 Tax=Pisolithus microcarpus 441 TaxID=765257 RepID=A0A0D0ACY0_9AGAM|nr:hypothetical protein PISMIDRAFT_671911 [Pisolithus microcarpus 441]
MAEPFAAFMLDPKKRMNTVLVTPPRTISSFRLSSIIMSMMRLNRFLHLQTQTG